jgi:hypothetical protein
MKLQSKRNNRKKITHTKRTKVGGFLGFGKSKNNPKQKFKDVLNASYLKLVEYRVKIQVENHDKLLKLTKDILTLDPFNHKEFTDKLVEFSTKKTNNYKSYISNRDWKKLISKSEEDIIRDLAYNQLQQLKDSYTDTSKSVNDLSDNLVRQFINQNRQK